MEKLEVWFPKRLAALCEEKHLSAYELSKKSDVGRSTISQLLNGKSLPSLPVLRRLCQGLGITEAEFYGGESSVHITPREKNILNLINNLPAQVQDSLIYLCHGFMRG